ncbi:cytochrome P450 27C1-like [Paramuricea clavata]|uniref:Cytochrome P450 27C1-like n=1 Tax=Paramuricea clavata TaxID=317549 RepID=A0A7D9J1V1_PARCT|nr:cytochrome P450 27C1-like [Paramuricea clavata]
MSMLTAKLLKHFQLRSMVVNSRTCTKWERAISLARSKSSATPTVEQHKYSTEPQMQLRDIPGPSTIENLTMIARKGFLKQHVYMAEMFARFGPMFRQSVPGGRHVVYISDPVDMEHVFRSQENNNPYRGDMLIADYARKSGLDRGINGDGESWSVYRKLVAPKLLQLGALKPYFTEILNVADDTVANFTDGKNVNLQDHLTKWGAESVVVVLFGLRIGTSYKSMNERAEAFIDAVNGHFYAEAKLIFSVPLHKHFETPTLKRAYRHVDTQLAIMREFAAETRKHETEIARNSLLTKLEQHDELSEENLMFLCQNLLIAAVHTTASSTLQLIDTLSKHPEVQRKAFEEIRLVLGDGQQAPSYQQLSEMKYLRALIKEGFRYNTAPPGNIRITKAPVTVRGYHIPPGTTVILSTIASKEMQRQKYNDPEKFAPERWLRRTDKEIHPFSSLPFSFGRRACLGRRVVNMEMALLVLRILQKYEILERKDPVNWVCHTVVGPDKPYSFYLKKRH